MPIVKIKIGEKKEKVIGYLDDREGIFRKSVWKSRHLFRKFDAWGLDAEYFTDVLYRNRYKIQVWEREEDMVYEISSEDFKKHAQYFHFKNAEEKEDYRAQIFCPRRFWLTLSKDDQETRDLYLKYCI